MASKSQINQIATVAVSQGVADMVIDSYGMCLDLKAYLCMDAILEAAQAALKTLGLHNLGLKSERRIKRLIDAFANYVTEDNSSLTTILSLSLALLDDVLTKTKKQYIENVYSAVFKAYSVFDPEYEFLESYENADLLQKRWDECLEGI